MTARMPLAADVVVDGIADACADGATGADLEALCRQAAFQALDRVGPDCVATGLHVTAADFMAAVRAMAVSVVPMATYRAWSTV